MAATRLTIIFTLPRVPETKAQSSPREAFWENLGIAVKKRTLVPYPLILPPNDYDAALYDRFGPELKSRLQQRINSTSSDWENLYFKVAQVRYGSALVDLDIYGLGAALKATGINEEFFMDMLELYSPDALVASVYGIAAPGVGTVLSASVQSKEQGVGQNVKPSRLLNAMGVSLLAPVIMAILLCYVAFVEMHDEKVRYLDQNKALMDHYQSEIDSLSSRLHFEESHSKKGTFISPRQPVQSTTGREPPVAPDAPRTGIWIFAGDALLLAALITVFFWGKKTWAKAAAILMALGATATHGYVHLEIKSFEVKVDNLFRSRPGVVQPPTQSGRIAPPLGPELLMNIDGFAPTSPAIPKNWGDFEQVCRKWKSHNPQGKEVGLILVVGGTDSTRMTGARGARFESNFGLAQARAEEVKKRIVGCGVNEKNILAMVFGPQHTPDLAGKTVPEEENQKDRRVQVWGFWAVPSNS